MTELHECPCRHPSKNRWQNRMPSDELGFNNSAKAPKILIACFEILHSSSVSVFLSAYHLFFFLFSLSFPLLSSLPSSCPFLLYSFISSLSPSLSSPFFLPSVPYMSFFFIFLFLLEIKQRVIETKTFFSPCAYLSNHWEDGGIHTTERTESFCACSILLSWVILSLILPSPPSLS